MKKQFGKISKLLLFLAEELSGKTACSRYYGIKDAVAECCSIKIKIYTGQEKDNRQNNHYPLKPVSATAEKTADKNNQRHTGQ